MKKYFFSVLVAFVILPGIAAQTVTEFKERIDYCFEIQDYDCARHSLARYMTLLGATSGTETEDYALGMMDIGLCFYYEQSWDTAYLYLWDAMTRLDSLEKLHTPKGTELLEFIADVFVQIDSMSYAFQFYYLASAAYAQLYGKDSEDVGIVQFKLGKQFFDMADYESAAEYLERAGNIFLNNEEAQESVFAPEILYYAGTNAIYLNDFEKAVPWLQKGLAIREKLSSEPDKIQGLICQNLGYIMYLQGKTKEAIAYYEKSTAIYEEVTEWLTDGDYWFAMSSLGYAYYTAGEYEKAEGAYNMCFNIFGINQWEQTPEYVTLLDEMADVMYALGRYSECEELLLQVKDLRKEILDPDHFDHVMSINNLIFVYRQQGKFDEAMETGMELLTLAQNLDPNKYSDRNQLYTHIAFLFSMGKKEDEAVEMYKKNLENMALSYPETYPFYLKTMQWLGDLYMITLKYPEAEQTYKELLTLREKATGKTNSLYANVLSDLCDVYDEQGKYDLAEEGYLEVLEIRKKVFGEEHADLSLVLNNLAAIYEHNDMYDKAEKAYLESARISEKVYGKNHMIYAVCVNNLGDLYRSLGRYEEAEKYLLETMQIREEILGRENPIFATSLGNLAFLYHDMGRYAESEEYYNEAIKMCELSMGEGHYECGTYYTNLASLYTDLGKYIEAEELYLEVLEMRRKAVGDMDLKVAVVVDNLGFLYSKWGRYEKAEELHKLAMQIREGVVGTRHSDYAVSLNNLGSLYKETGRYKESEELFLQALELKTELMGENHPNVAVSMENLAQLYMTIGALDKVESLTREAMRIRKEFFGTNHPSYANSVDNLAGYFAMVGNYQEAEKLYMESEQIYLDNFGEQHEQYAMTLNNMGSFYDEIGDYGLAEEYYQRAIDIVKSVHGSEHPQYAISIENLASFYQEMGNLEQAIPLYIEALEIKERLLGATHADYLSSLENMAVLNALNGNYTEAEQALLTVLKVKEQTIGKDNELYTNTLLSLGHLYLDMGRLEDCEKYYLQAKKSIEDTYGKEHRFYGNLLSNIAILYNGQGKSSQAEKYLLESLEITENTLGTEHRKYIIGLSNLGAHYENLDQNDKAEKYHVKANEKIFDQLLKNFAFMSEKEKQLFIGKNESYFLGFHSFALKRQPENPEITTHSYNNELFLKGVLLQSSRRLQDNIMNSNDQELVGLYMRWVKLREEIGILYTLPPDKRLNDPANLEEQANDLEKELVKRSQDFSEGQASIAVNWSDIRDALADDEAAVEFINFQYYSKGWTDSTLYCALILRKDFEYPEMIYLFREKDMQALLDKSDASSDPVYVSDLYGTRGARVATEAVQPRSEKLYSMIWKKMEEHLRAAKRIYISPSGLLHKISFPAIPVNDTLLLADRYQLFTVTSTRQILDKTAASVTGENAEAVIYGGILYDIEESKLSEMSAGSSAVERSTRSAVIPEDASRGSSWTYLAGTLDEADRISSLLTDKNVKASVFTGEATTEESFKNIQTQFNPAILHLATHGFFFPEPEENLEGKNTRAGLDDNLFKTAENPLMRSGLILAGANHVWEGGNPVPGLEDGILTAYEVANTNLSGTELVVLSACETGLGDIQGSEGVYGLQRSFKMAGADFIIMSLWQVPDQQTVELMTVFYENWLSGTEIREAFANAQLAMRAKYDPFYWAAFVLVK